jgi:hypothetical protein
MSKFIGRLLVVLAFGWAGNASAVPISAADIVNVGGQEWAQVDLFTSNSWNTINAQCPSGLCLTTSTVNGYSLDGWTWASIDEVQSLFNTFTGQVASAPAVYSEQGSTWAPELLQLFNPTDFLPGILSRVSGFTASLTGTNGYLGRVDDSLVFGPGDVVSTAVTTSPSFGSLTIGAWFVRDANQVPTPATIPLLGIALAALGFSRKRKQHQFV